MIRVADIPEANSLGRGIFAMREVEGGGFYVSTALPGFFFKFLADGRIERYGDLSTGGEVYTATTWRGREYAWVYGTSTTKQIVDLTKFTGIEWTTSNAPGWYLPMSAWRPICATTLGQSMIVAGKYLTVGDVLEFIDPGSPPIVRSSLFTADAFSFAQSDTKLYFGTNPRSTGLNPSADLNPKLYQLALNFTVDWEALIPTTFTWIGIISVFLQVTQVVAITYNSNRIGAFAFDYSGNLLRASTLATSTVGISGRGRNSGRVVNGRSLFVAGDGLYELQGATIVPVSLFDRTIAFPCGGAVIGNEYYFASGPTVYKYVA